jgi:DNA-binding transcriptional LysR family regulator
VDLVVRLTDDPSQGMVARALMPVRQLVLASPDYLAKHGAVETPHDLLAHSCLSLGEHALDNRWHFIRGGEEAEVTVNGRYTINHSEMRLAAIEASLGVGCVPDFVAGEALASGRVVELLPDWTFDSHYQGKVQLLFTASRYTAPKVRALIDHLVATVGQDSGIR